jgi:hypothetical protein
MHPLGAAKRKHAGADEGATHPCIHLLCLLHGHIQLMHLVRAHSVPHHARERHQINFLLGIAIFPRRNHFLPVPLWRVQQRQCGCRVMYMRDWFA